MRKMSKIAVLLLVAGIAATAVNAAPVELVATSVTNGQIIDGKTVKLSEGGTVTVSIYFSNLGTYGTSPATNGVGNFSVSVRSGDGTSTGLGRERYNVSGASPDGTLWPAVPSAAATVVNATGSVLSAPSNFDLGRNAGSITDLHATMAPKPDDWDTDTDLQGMTATQQPGGDPYLIGWGASTQVLVGTVTFSALDLVDGTYPFDRRVWLTIPWTNVGGSNGGLVIKGLTGSDTQTNGISTVNTATSAAIIGLPVVVTVVPEPATLGLLVLGGAGVLLRRRRS